ncbi:MAG TPA: hypothetical protein VKZ63_00440 [Kofleriaceae bacterium]|nr:hypothetical protein [Kofleriaceae bacterium]
MTRAIPCLGLVLALAACGGDDDGASGPDAGTCTPRTCAAAGVGCGTIDDGCGGTVECTCAWPAECGARGQDHLCAIPEAARTCLEGGWCFESPAPLPMMVGDLHARSASDVWAVGLHGQARHFDGSVWTAVDTGTAAHLLGVWSGAADEVWVVGDEGTLLRGPDGFAPVAAGQGAAVLSGVHGSAADDVWVVGDGISLRWDGAAWSPAAATTPTLHDVSALGPTQAWATGVDAIYRWSPSGWQVDADPDSVDLTGVHARSASDVWVVGAFELLLDVDELVYHWNGTSWASLDPPVEGRVHGVYGSPDHVVAVREHSLTSLVGPEPPAIDISIAAGAAVSAEEQFLVSRGGQLFELDGETWRQRGFGAPGDLRAIATTGEHVWVAGDGAILEWRGGGFFLHRLPFDSTRGAIVAIGGPAPDDVWAVDMNVPFWSETLWHWDGVAWEERELPGLLDAVYAIHPRDDGVYLVGETVHRWDGSAWVAEAAPSATWLAAADGPDGRLWLAGTRDGAALVAVRGPDGWTELPAAAGEVACAIAVTGEDEVWISSRSYPSEGEQATLARWDGGAWSSLAMPGAGDRFATEQDALPCGLVVRGPDDVWATPVAQALDSAGGALLHHDGETWSSQPLLQVGAVNGVAVGPDGGLWVAGDFGALLRRQ